MHREDKGMDMHRRGPLGPEGGAVAGRDIVAGTCALAPQAVLDLGQDRRRPVPWRPVVCVQARRSLRYVFACTTNRRRRFFHLSAAQCAAEPGRRGLRESWLAPRLTLVGAHGLYRLGALAQEDALPRLLDWYRTHLRGLR
jgi:hypothetical protein